MLSTRMQSATFAPNHLPNLQLWLDAADVATITESSGAVSQWNDKSGNGYDVKQSTGSAQPTTDATTQHGKNVLDFSGSNYLATDVNVATSSNSTIFIVYQNTNTFPVGGADVDIMLRHDNPSGSDYNLTSSNGFIDTSKPRFRRENGGSVSLFINGDSDTTDSELTSTFFVARVSASSTPSYSGAIVLGATASGGFGHTGSIAEVLYYSRVLQESEANTVENYLASKWGIVLV